MFGMESIIVSLVTVLAPVFLVSFGTIKRDKRDRKVRKIAEELGMHHAVQKIDARREERINGYISQFQGVGAFIWMLTRVGITLIAVAFLIIWIPIIKELFEGDSEMRSIAPWISLVGLGFSLVALGVAMWWRRKVNKELAYQTSSNSPKLHNQD